jgi:hypothetical protein
MKVTNAAKFGLTEGEAARLMALQQDACAVCRKKFRPGRPPVVDHHHVTGRVRGLLCSPCNRQLGYLHEDVGWLTRAADYVTYPPAGRYLDRPVYTPGSAGAAGLTPKERP